RLPVGALRLLVHVLPLEPILESHQGTRFPAGWGPSLTPSWLRVKLGACLGMLGRGVRSPCCRVWARHGWAARRVSAPYPWLSTRAPTPFAQPAVAERKPPNYYSTVPYNSVLLAVGRRVTRRGQRRQPENCRSCRVPPCCIAG